MVYIHYMMFETALWPRFYSSFLPPLTQELKHLLMFTVRAELTFEPRTASPKSITTLEELLRDRDPILYQGMAFCGIGRSSPRSILS